MRKRGYVKKDIVKIHGKNYETVASRVSRFREEHPKFGIRTKLIESNDSLVIMKATIVNEEDFVLGTGYAEENRSASQINKTSALENCETSAIGRALAAIGYAGTEYASANEVISAIHQQSYQPSHNKEASSKQKMFITNLLQQRNVEHADMKDYIASEWGVDTDNMSQDDANTIISDLDTKER